MIKYVKGDIFSTPAQVLVNTVNLEGVMGKGIALNYKKMYPDMFIKYQKLCKDNKLQIGKLWLYKTNNKWILNFPTKKEWRKPSKIEYIKEGLEKFVNTYREKNITSIAFPKLGCGNGGLKWEDVKPLMDFYLKNLPIDIYIYEELLFDKSKHQEEKVTNPNLSEHIDTLRYVDFKADLISESYFKNKNLLNIENEIIYNIWSDLNTSDFVKITSYYTKEFSIIYDLCMNLSYILCCQIREGLDGQPYDALQLCLPMMRDESCQMKMNI